MSLRIDNNPEAHPTRPLAGADESAGRRLVSGSRIDRAGDANGLAPEEGARAAIRDLGAAARDALDGMTLVQAADASMGGVDAALRRLREMAGRASDEGLPASHRADLDAEARSLLDGIRAAMSDDAPGGATGHRAGAAGLDLDLDMGLATPAAAASALPALDGAIRSVEEIRAGLGVVQNRLERTINRARLGAENVEAAASRIRDADRAAEMVGATRRQITDEPVTAMAAQANHTGNGVLRLLSHP